MSDFDEFQRMQDLKAWFTGVAAENPVDVPLGEDEWSLAQVIEHLVIVEKGLLVAMSRAKEPMPAETPNLAKLQKILDSGRRYEVPVPAAVPSDSPDLPAVLDAWAKVREKLQARIAARELPGDGIMVYDHPVGGPMNAAQALQFLAGHLVYHKLRTESLLAAAVPN